MDCPRREGERPGLLFIQSHFLDTHSLLAVPIDCKVSVSGMFLKFTDQLSKARRAKQNHSWKSTVQSFLYPSPQLLQAFLGNLQATLVGEAGRLTTDLHLSFQSSKPDLPDSSILNSSADHLLQPLFPSSPLSNGSHRSSTLMPLPIHSFTPAPNYSRDSLGTCRPLWPGEQVA